uniref:Putative secreted protein n=1 Tax=Anopheles darlingi TaxID=43151 RepID=A0A2M4DPF7_ANODA
MHGIVGRAVRWFFFCFFTFPFCIIPSAACHHPKRAVKQSLGTHILRRRTRGEGTTNCKHSPPLGRRQKTGPRKNP